MARPKTATNPTSDPIVTESSNTTVLSDAADERGRQGHHPHGRQPPAAERRLQDQEDAHQDGQRHRDEGQPLPPPVLEVLQQLAVVLEREVPGLEEIVDVARDLVDVAAGDVDADVDLPGHRLVLDDAAGST